MVFPRSATLSAVRFEISLQFVRVLVWCCFPVVGDSDGITKSRRTARGVSHHALLHVMSDRIQAGEQRFAVVCLDGQLERDTSLWRVGCGGQSGFSFPLGTDRKPRGFVQDNLGQALPLRSLGGCFQPFNCCRRSFRLRVGAGNRS